ncbi:glycerol acyltransferase [Actinorhabdospora filicis]|uniref:Glycerol acyltransferase n=1 Tax=Actinorhabdospora filicis TaxID=1785913 RepID=A0A9W6SK18_9ACTN|nr:lysophospholipid acyltransferase family protein [Actinorhabdospora filicis]GLZ77382.1 glycerol acyltransferase [Actinorhabdospora filicis]
MSLEDALGKVIGIVERRLAGDYEVDEFGFDKELTEDVVAPVLRPLYRKWFRVEMHGLENVPDTGSALIVGNHSGAIAMDAAMLQLGLLDDHPARRHLRLLGADFVFKTPLLGEYARKTGATLACTPDAERLLSSGHLVGVFPEGFKGVGKPVWERYRLQRFGRGGFVQAALKTGAPIIPVSIVGAEEIYPIIGDIKPLARLLGLPYFPVTPTFPWLGPFGAVPLPSKWHIRFGEPIDTKEYAEHADDPMEIFNLADQVKETIQGMIHELLEKRGGAFQP